MIFGQQTCIRSLVCSHICQSDLLDTVITTSSSESKASLYITIVFSGGRDHMME